MLGKALSLLSERERTIFSYRRLAEEPKTLEVLSKEFNISRERVRQIEVKAFEKVQLEVKNISNSHNNLVIENHKNNKST
jgi:RNA polymerase sigma-32 factor